MIWVQAIIRPRSGEVKYHFSPPPAATSAITKTLEEPPPPG